MKERTGGTRPKEADSRLPGERARTWRRQRTRRRQTRRKRLITFSMLAVFVLFLAVLLVRSLDTGPAPVLSTATGGQNASAAPSRSGSFTVSTSGDILIHSPVWIDAQANGGDGSYDFTPMFKPIGRYVKNVDLAICHVETPITTGEPTGYPIFSAPADLAKSIHAAGWKACDTASNHSLDQGQAGIDQTGELLKAAGVDHTGSASSRKAADRPVVLSAGPAKVGLVAYTDATNGIPAPNRWSVNLLPVDEPASEKAARVARDVKQTLAAGADAVIVNMQWGDENSRTPNPSQRSLAREIVKIDGVAAIAGQGPHVVQPIERINGKFVVFSEGNLLSNQGAYSGLPAATQDGLIALFRFNGNADAGFKVTRVDYVPVMVNPAGHAVLPTGSGSRFYPELAGSLAESWQRTVDVAGRGARIRPIPFKQP